MTTIHISLDLILEGAAAEFYRTHPEKVLSEVKAHLIGDPEKAGAGDIRIDNLIIKKDGQDKKIRP